ncbi:hypothetical protein KAU33_15765 [Candidatus Dependentiae bacterium]|nr:hypothetical protein [Candidatus Dependentiae bacterium]
MNDVTNNKIELEVTFGDQKAIVKILAVTYLYNKIITDNINDIIEQNKIEYYSVISKDNRMPLDYPETIRLIENEMFKNDIEIYIYYFREKAIPGKRPKPHIPIIFYIILIALMLIGLLAALLAGFVVFIAN